MTALRTSLQRTTTDVTGDDDEGLRPDDQARSIAIDARRESLLYLGTERGIWASWSGGAWQRISGDLPAVSVRDIESSPTNDLVIATHGRGAYVLDDATILQDIDDSDAPVSVLPIRDAVEWNLNAYYGTRVDAPPAPYGALISYVVRAPTKEKISAEILDAHGNLVRTLDDLSAQAGANRVVWDMTGEPAQPWRYAPKWNRGTDGGGATVVPGRYTVRVRAGAQTYARSFVVSADPRERTSLSQMQRHYDAQVALIATFSRIDDGLDLLSTIAQEAPLRAKAVASNAQLAQRVSELGAQASAAIATITSNPRNDQDNDFLTDLLRERMQTELDTYEGSWSAPTAEQMREDGVLQHLAADRLASVAHLRDQLAGVDAELRAHGLKPLEISTTGTPRDEAGDGDDTDRR